MFIFGVGYGLYARVTELGLDAAVLESNEWLYRSHDFTSNQESSICWLLIKYIYRYWNAFIVFLTIL